MRKITDQELSKIAAMWAITQSPNIDKADAFMEGYRYAERYIFASINKEQKK